MCKHCNEIVEIYLGMDGFIAKTAPEAYLQHVLSQIYDYAKQGTNINVTNELELDTEKTEAEK